MGLHRPLAVALACFALAGCTHMLIETDPPGASLYLNGRYLGKTPYTGVFWAGEDQNATAEAVLPGHDRSECLHQTRAPGMTALEISTAPPGAHITMDGQYYGQAPLFANVFFPSHLKGVWSKETLAKYRKPTKPPPVSPPARPAEPEPTPLAAPAPGEQRRVAIVVGVSRYKHRGKWGLSNLRYAARDAEALAAHLRSDRGGRFDQVEVLTDDRATTRNLRIALKETLRATQKGDFVVVYWSGHGSPDPSDLQSLYLITHDTDPAHMAATGYSMREFTADMAALRAGRVLIVADTCHSAGISDPSIGTRGLAQNKIVEGLRGLSVASRAKAPAATMRMIFTSCETGELSRESSKFGGGYGVFTWFLMQGLQGEADKPASGGDGDGNVTLGELIEYTRDRVKRATGNQQHPDTAGRFDRKLVMSVAQ